MILLQWYYMQVPIYATAHLTGATLAAFTIRVLLHPIKTVGITTPTETSSQALIMEILVTFIMMFVTSAVATDSKAVCSSLFTTNLFHLS